MTYNPIFTLIGIELLINQRPKLQNPSRLGGTKNQGLFNNTSWNLGLDPDSSYLDGIWDFMRAEIYPDISLSQSGFDYLM
jgi:hypothetical protein